MSARFVNSERSGSEMGRNNMTRDNMTPANNTCTGKTRGPSAVRPVLRSRRNHIRKLCLAYCKIDRRDVRTRFDQIKCLCAELSLESLARPAFFCPLVCAVLGADFDSTDFAMDFDEWRVA